MGRVQRGADQVAQPWVLLSGREPAPWAEARWVQGPRGGRPAAVPPRGGGTRRRRRRRGRPTAVGDQGPGGGGTGTCLDESSRNPQAPVRGAPGGPGGPGTGVGKYSGEEEQRPAMWRALRERSGNAFVLSVRGSNAAEVPGRGRAGGALGGGRGCDRPPSADHRGGSGTATAGKELCAHRDAGQGIGSEGSASGARWVTLGRVPGRGQRPRRQRGGGTPRCPGPRHTGRRSPGPRLPPGPGRRGMRPAAPAPCGTARSPAPPTPGTPNAFWGIRDHLQTAIPTDPAGAPTQSESPRVPLSHTCAGARRGSSLRARPQWSMAAAHFSCRCSTAA